MARTKAELERLIQGAMGIIKADLIITGGKVVNVYSGEILDGIEISVLDGRICYTGLSAEHARGEQTQIIDAKGKYVSPGFIDGHTHFGHYARPFEHLQSFVARGTTAVVASCDEFSTVFGYRGLEVFLDEVERHSVRVYSLVSMVAPQDPLLCDTATFSNDEIRKALSDPRVLGMGEIVSWLRLLQCDTELLERIEMAQQKGQIIHGHTAGARDQKLCAVAACGISSCHEPVRFEDALARLRLGYWTMLREGSLRQDLEATLRPLLQSGVSLQRLILVTDSTTPDDVAEFGHMDHVVRRAISLGLPPIQALQAVTLNPALYSGLEQDIGGIAPGRCADIVLLECLDDCLVTDVLIGGKRVAKDGISLVDAPPLEFPGDMLNSLRFKPTVIRDLFKIPAPFAASKIRVMSLINQTITAERILDVDTGSGFVVANLNEDLLKVAIFDRQLGKIAFGFLQGFGARIGAVALTTNLDENTLMVIGSDDGDMALCANALIESGGGIAIAQNGAIVERLDFPFGGICSLDSWQKVGSGLRRIQNRLKEMGSSFDKPIFALNFLPFVTLPSLRITARGLVNAKERKIVSLFADELA
ncbi:MAG: amidohydrolase family protein [Deltaproteobacteria bacterium]|nr:amidohydrolase family protein [Deltaproteobacteria bacterium]